MPELECDDCVIQDPASGFSLIEVLAALSFLAFGALVVMSTMAKASGVDAVNRDRAEAIRAGMMKMNEVISHDDGGDFQNFLDYWSDPVNASFEVDGLQAPSSMGEEYALASPAQGIVESGAALGQVDVDTTDPNQVIVTVTVQWEGQLGSSAISLPYLMTEVVK